MAVRKAVSAVKSCPCALGTENVYEWVTIQYQDDQELSLYHNPQDLIHISSFIDYLLELSEGLSSKRTCVTLWSTTMAMASMAYAMR